MIKFYLRTLVFVLILLTSNTLVNGQVSQYAFSQGITPGAYNNLILANNFQSGSALGFDFISGENSFPNNFTFTYNCRKYNSFRVSNNGFILLGVFGNPAITQSNAIANTTNIPAEAVIQPFGADLTNSIASGSIPSIDFGMDPTNATGAFVVQYKDMARSNANADRINFQIWLFPNGQIQFRYGNCLPSSTQSSTTSPTVGIKGAYTNDFNVRSVTTTGTTTTWTNSGLSTSIFSTSRYVGSGVSPYGSIYPLNNLVYSFSPQGCFVPVYENAPACSNFETEWINNGSYLVKMPSSSWSKWPITGQNAWFSEYENAGISKWTNATLGLFAPSGANGTLHSARFHTYSLANGYYGDLNWSINLSACPSTNKELNFYYVHNTTGTDGLSVYLSTDGGVNFTLLNTYGPSPTWSKQTLNLGIVSSPNCVIRFRGLSDGISEAGSDIGIDEVCISNTGIAPVLSTSPSVSTTICKVGQGNSSINLVASGALNYKWSPVDGLNTTHGASVIANPSGTTTYTVIASDANCATNSKTITVDVAPTIQLKTTATPSSLCYGSNATLTVSDSAIGPQFLPYGYCITGPISNLDEDCGKVIFAGINNTSAQNSLIGSQGNATGVASIYSDFKSTVPAAQVITGQTYPFSVTVIDDGGTTFQNSFKAFIDYNRDGDFDDVGELIFTSGTNFGGSTQGGNVVIPSTAKAGVTVLRICVYETTPTSINACGTPNNFGEVEDYAVNIINKPAIAGSGSSYVWSPSTYLNSSTGASVTASNVINNITYTLTATDASGCSAISLRQLFVSSTSGLSTSNIAGTSNVCLGASANLSTISTGGTPPYTYQWSGPNISGSGNAVSVAPTLTSTYTVTVTDGCGANVTKTKIVAISGAPNVVATASPNSICSGQQTTLQATGALSYTWAGGYTSGVPFIPSSTSIYTVTGTSSNGCTKTSTVTVTINSLPSVGASASPGANICNGESVTLLGAGASTYIWTNGVTNGVPFTPSSTTTYTVTGTSNAGCTKTSILTVSVNAKPTVLATKQPSNPTCLSVPITLSGSGANSYAWSGGATNNVAFSPTATTTYTVTGTASNGCTNTATVEAVVLQLPIINTTATPSNSVCLNDPVTLTGSGASSYTWSGGISNNAAFNPTATTTYTVTGTSSNGCTNTSTATITVKALPSISINVSPNDSICLNASVSLGALGATTFSWNGGITNNIAFSPLTTTTYTVTGTASNGCTNTSTQMVTVKSLPTISVSASPSNSICLNESVQLSGSGGSAYVWSGGVSNGVSFSPTSTGTYTVTGTATNGCTNTNTQAVTVKSLPNIQGVASPSSSLCEGTNALLSGSGGSNYLWSGGVTDNISFLPLTTMIYTVTGTGSNGCENSSTVSIEVKPKPNVSVMIDPSGALCQGNVATLTANGGSSYSWNGGVVNGAPFVAQSTGIYTVTVSNSQSCTATSVANIVVNNSSQLALANMGNIGSVAGNVTDNMTQHDGSALSYTSTACDKIAIITDNMGGNTLGSVSAKVTVAANLPNYIGQPYAKRWYDITPASNGAAIVTLFFTQADFNDYNAGSLGLPFLPTTGNNSDPYKGNIRITKVDGVLGTGTRTVITPTSNWNASENYWELTFPVSSFSQFYLHTEGTAPLPVQLLSFTGKKDQNKNVLQWQTISEQNNDYFNVLKSIDNQHFESIGVVNSKAINGNSSAVISYSFIDNNVNIGNNFYKLKQIDIDGSKSFSKTINLIWAELFSEVVVFPNPANELINIDYESEEDGAIMHVKILDMSGRVVAMSESFATLGHNNITMDLSKIAQGIYTLQLFEDAKLFYNTRVLKTQ